MEHNCTKTKLKVGGMGRADGKNSRMVSPTQKLDAQQLFAKNMRRIRKKEKQLTQEQVAERAGLHPNYISSVERGERNISIANIERIARALDVTMAELVTPKKE